MTYLWYWPSGGWDFDAWRARQTWRPERASCPRREDLWPLLRRGALGADVEAARSGWAAALTDVLGTVEDSAPRRMTWEASRIEDLPSYRRSLLHYSLTDNETGFAWLLEPYAGSQSRPAVIALHQTVPYGKDEPVGLEGDPALAYGHELALRGYVVLAPDAIAFGDRLAAGPEARYHSALEFFGRHPEGSVMAKMCWDVSRAVDLLERLPGVDARRIGCIGHSHGAYGTLFAMAAEPRIAAGVVSCGISPFRTDPTPERWWRRTALLPRLGLWEGDMPSTPLDFHVVAALAAPRPLFITAGLQDAIFPNLGSLPNLISLLRAVYRCAGAARGARAWIHNGPHSFPASAKTRAYRMLDDLLVGS